MVRPCLMFIRTYILHIYDAVMVVTHPIYIDIYMLQYAFMYAKCIYVEIIIRKR